MCFLKHFLSSGSFFIKDLDLHKLIVVVCLPYSYSPSGPFSAIFHIKIIWARKFFNSYCKSSSIGRLRWKLANASILALTELCQCEISVLMVYTVISFLNAPLPKMVKMIYYRVSLVCILDCGGVFLII